MRAWKIIVRCYFCRFVLASLFILPLHIYAQDFKADIQKINDAYAGSPDFSMSITYNYYDNFSTDAINKSEKAEFKKEGLSQLYKIAYLEMLINAKYSVMVDNNQKVIMVSDPPKKRPKSYFPIDIDSGLKLIGKEENLAAPAGLRGYRIKMNHGDYEMVDVYFDTQSYFIEKMVIYQRKPVSINNSETATMEKPRLEIICSDINLAPKFKENTFSETRYIKVSPKKEVQNQPRYVGYKIINSLKLTGPKHK